MVLSDTVNPLDYAKTYTLCANLTLMLYTDGACAPCGKYCHDLAFNICICHTNLSERCQWNTIYSGDFDCLCVDVECMMLSRSHYSKSERGPLPRLHNFLLAANTVMKIITRIFIPPITNLISHMQHHLLYTMQAKGYSSYSSSASACQLTAPTVLHQVPAVLYWWLYA